MQYRPPAAWLCITALWLAPGAALAAATTTAAAAAVAAPTSGLRMQVFPAGEPAEAGVFRPPGAMHDTRIGHGRNDIAYAWFSRPSEQYRHYALGDAAEATVLNVQTRDGALIAHSLEDDAVFEDLQPRVVDLDGDGRDEIVVVRSRRLSGSSLMAVGIRNGRLVQLAESPPTGTQYLWMNPAGIADVDGDGRFEVLAVLHPHVDGELVVYRYGEGRFSEVQRVGNVSNHVFGSRDQGMSVLLDANRDGRPDLAIPSGDRSQLRVFSFGPGPVLREFARVQLPAPADGDFELVGASAVIVPLEDGRRVRLDWR